jgi:integrase
VRDVRPLALELTTTLGHSDPRTTKAIYGHLFPDSRQVITGKLDNYLGLAGQAAV